MKMSRLCDYLFVKLYNDIKIDEPVKISEGEIPAGLSFMAGYGNDLELVKFCNRVYGSLLFDFFRTFKNFWFLRSPQVKNKAFCKKLYQKLYDGTSCRSKNVLSGKGSLGNHRRYRIDKNLFVKLFKRLPSLEEVLSLFSC